jgi:hypothetical protein
MTCPKCITGLVVVERNYDAHEGRGYLTMTKCLCCGYYEDDTIRANQRATGSSFPTFDAPEKVRRTDFCEVEMFKAREMVRYEEVLK